jgi:hypothetical protein
MKNRNIFLLTTLAAILIFNSSFSINEWVLFRKSNYSILFPGNPATDSSIKNTQIGDLTIINHIYETPENTADSNLVYGLSVTDYPPKFILQDSKPFIKGFFEGVVKGAVNGVAGKLIEEKDFAVKNYPGKELKIDYDNGTAIITMKILLVRERVYTLQTITLPGQEVNANATRFYSSFDFQ